MSPWLTVVGIGEDGFKGLGRNARHALLRATQIIGAQRQLDLLPVCIRGAREVWPSPFSLEPVLARRFEPVCVLASGDPMFYGLAPILARKYTGEYVSDSGDLFATGPFSLLGREHELVVGGSISRSHWTGKDYTNADMVNNAYD